MSRRNLLDLSAIAVMGFFLLSGKTIAQRALPAGTEYDVVIRDGRVMDPESGLDAIRNVCIRVSKISL